MCENDDFNNNNKLLESKESIDNQSNSIFIKSFDYENFNYTDLLKNKKLLKISFNTSDNTIEIQTNAVKKILSKIEKGSENLEILYSKYITALVPDNENSLNKENLLENEENYGVLDTVFVQLLNQTKKYHISFPNKENNTPKEIFYDINIDKIPIPSNAIKKIFRFLQKNIYDMSDYINIILLNMNEEGSNTSIFKTKILDKYIHSNSEITDIGVKYLNLNLEIPQKNRPTKLNKIDVLFNNTLNHIENQYETPLDRDDKSEENSELNIPKINIIDEMDDPESKEEEAIFNSRYRRYKCGNELCNVCNIF